MKQTNDEARVHVVDQTGDCHTLRLDLYRVCFCLQRCLSYSVYAAAEEAMAENDEPAVPETPKKRKRKSEVESLLEINEGSTVSWQYHAEIWLNAYRTWSEPISKFINGRASGRRVRISSFFASIATTTTLATRNRKQKSFTT